MMPPPPPLPPQPPPQPPAAAVGTQHRAGAPPESLMFNMQMFDSGGGGGAGGGDGMGLGPEMSFLDDAGELPRASMSQDFAVSGGVAGGFEEHGGAAVDGLQLPWSARRSPATRAHRPIRAPTRPTESPAPLLNRTG